MVSSVLIVANDLRELVRGSHLYVQMLICLDACAYWDGCFFYTCAQWDANLWWHGYTQYLNTCRRLACALWDGCVLWCLCTAVMLVHSKMLMDSKILYTSISIHRCLAALASQHTTILLHTCIHMQLQLVDRVLAVCLLISVPWNAPVCLAMRWWRWWGGLVGDGVWRHVFRGRVNADAMCSDIYSLVRNVHVKQTKNGWGQHPLHSMTLSPKVPGRPEVRTDVLMLLVWF